MSQIKAFVRDRDAALRSLNEAAFDKFAREWSVPQPAQWKRGAKLAAMHKARLQIISFTPEEKALSRAWLASNGFSEQIGGGRPCPECGSLEPSHSNCSTCGMAHG
jgi:hypothetical protein